MRAIFPIVYFRYQVRGCVIFAGSFISVMALGRPKDNYLRKSLFDNLVGIFALSFDSLLFQPRCTRLIQEVQVNLCQKLLFLHQLTSNTYDGKLFIELQVQYMKIPSSNLGRTCCVQKFFLTFRTIFVHNMFSRCSAKRRASDKELPVLQEQEITPVKWDLSKL